MKNLTYALVLAVLSTSCMTSHVFEEAQTIGEGNHAVSGSLARGVFMPEPLVIDQMSNLYLDSDIGTARFHYTYGIGEHTEIGIGADLPIGFRAHFKQEFNVKNLHHVHGLKVDLFAPLIYYAQDIGEHPIFGFAPSYIYTYRHDDLLSFSTNITMQAFQTQERSFGLPGISTGIHVGDQLKFTAGVGYFNNFGYLSAAPIQFLTVEAGFKYDLIGKSSK